MERKPTKPRAVNFSLIPPADNGHTPEPYRILEKIREKYHENLDGAMIALAWRKRLKRDKDGHLLLGKCVKVSDLNKEFAEFDFIIILNKEAWAEFNEKQKSALIDHELCHADHARDKYGDRVNAERGRTVWRVRKHDIEEFYSIVQHHGCYKRDLEKFAELILEEKQTGPKLPIAPAEETPVAAKPN